MKNVKNRPYLVAITGSFGSGKSTVIDILKNKGFKALKADDITKRLWEDSNFKSTLSSLLGLENDSNLKQNTKKLVFENKEKLEILNNYTLPLLNQELENFIQNNNSEKILFYENALIYEQKQEEFFDFCLLVFTSFENQVERLEKLNIDKDIIQNIINNQYSNNKKVLMADGVIYNNDEIGLLEEKTNDLLEVIFNEPYFRN